MDPFTAEIGPLITAVAGAALAWVVIRGREAAPKAQPVGADLDSQRERLYRRSFKTSPVGLAVLTSQGQWVRVNDRMRTLLGYKRDELGKLTIRELTHSDDRKVEAAHIRRLMRREISSYSIQKRLLCKDSKYRRFEVSMVRFEGEGDQELWQCVVSPLAAATADEAVEKNVRLGPILEPINDLAYFSYDDQGIIIEWNAGATRIFGYDREEIVGRSRTTLYRDADVWEQKPLRDLREAVASGRFEVDDTRVGRDGVDVRLKITIIPGINTLYEAALKALYGKVAIREIYGATEGMFGQQRDNKRAWVPNYDMFFFEVATRQGIKMLHEMRPGERGGLVVSTPILPRYRMGDLILAFDPPYFRCIGRESWTTPLRYAWDGLMTFNLGQL